jgi:nucleoside-diphosphate-sugar epimerase
MVENQKISIKEQWFGKRVLITGTTGFLGKVLIEKILRERLPVSKMVLLIRGNDRYPTARERFDHEIVTSTVFDRLRQDSPDAFRLFCRDRVECVTAEVTEKYFGLGKEAFVRLARRVDLVIHAAACVGFREPLHEALKINTLSLLHLADLVREAGNVPFVHVSTCYVNGFKTGDCREEVVEPVGGAFKKNARGFCEVLPVLEKLNQKIRKIEKRYIHAEDRLSRLVELGVKESHRYGFNDTYTFTKWLGEQVIMQALSDATLTIVRPGIIESTYREPVPGWVEGVKVADAVILAYAREKTPFFPARAKGVIDIVPADLVANSLILAAAEALARPGIHRIYQCSTGSVNPITVGRMRQLLQSEANRHAAAYARLFPKGRPQRDFQLIDRRLFVLSMAVLRCVVSVYDGICKRMGVKNRWRKLTDFVQTTLKLAVTFSFYASPSYIFHNDKLMELSSRVMPDERCFYPVDARIIDWERYMGPIHLSGLNRYALRDRQNLRGIQAKESQAVPGVIRVPVVDGSL